MPFLYRNIVPHVPLQAADNGKLVYRAGVPSYQRTPTFTAQWMGNLDTTSWVNYINDTYGTSFDPIIYTAAEINAAATTTDTGKPYGEMAIHQGTVDGQTVDAMMPCEFEAEIWVGGYRELYIVMSACIEWDATSHGWRWFVDEDDMMIRVTRHESGGTGHTGTYARPGGGLATYAQALKTTTIRASSGQTIPFASCDTSDSWREPGLLGTALHIDAHY